MVRDRTPRSGEAPKTDRDPPPVVHTSPRIPSSHATRGGHRSTTVHAEGFFQRQAQTPITSPPLQCNRRPLSHCGCYFLSFFISNSCLVASPSDRLDPVFSPPKAHPCRVTLSCVFCRLVSPASSQNQTRKKLAFLKQTSMIVNSVPRKDEIIQTHKVDVMPCTCRGPSMLPE